MIDLKKKEPKKKKKREFADEDFQRLIRFLVRVAPLAITVSIMPVMFAYLPEMSAAIVNTFFAVDENSSGLIYGDVQEKLLVDEDYVIFIEDEEYIISGGDWIHLEKGDSVVLERNVWESFDYQVEVLEVAENDN